MMSFLALEILAALPFGGLLLSLSLFPSLAPSFWHRFSSKVVLFWGAGAILGLLLLLGATETFLKVSHTLFHDFFSFICLIGALFIIGGGIHITLPHPAHRPSSVARPTLLNIGCLAVGAFLANFIGTTGASMVMIRPLLTLNEHRRHRKHLVIFFIFLVSNLGGSLTPLGDPPLYLGFLEGVPFLWTLKQCWFPTLMLCSALLLIVAVVDGYYLFRESTRPLPSASPSPSPMVATHPSWRFYGKRNGVALIAVLLIVFLLGKERGNLPFLTIAGLHLSIAEMVANGFLLLVAFLSYRFTPAQIHYYNRFSFEPLKEVVVVFAGIFITLIPVLHLLQAGESGPFAPLMSFLSPQGTPDPFSYFWTTGLFSAFLDNAPTYLIFFHAAGGNVDLLTTTYSSTLMAISLGSVFMGALTYIGNAPNLMIKMIAEHRNISMPNFFGYMLWSGGILMPLFLLMAWTLWR